MWYFPPDVDVHVVPRLPLCLLAFLFKQTVQPSAEPAEPTRKSREANQAQLHIRSTQSQPRGWVDSRSTVAWRQNKYNQSCANCKSFAGGGDKFKKTKPNAQAHTQAENKAPCISSSKGSRRVTAEGVLDPTPPSPRWSPCSVLFSSCYFLSLGHSFEVGECERAIRHDNSSFFLKHISSHRAVHYLQL